MFRSPSVNCPIWVHLLFDVWNVLLMVVDLVIGVHCNAQWVTIGGLSLTGFALALLHFEQLPLDASFMKNYFREYHFPKCYCQACALNEDPWFAFVGCKLATYIVPNTLFFCYTVPRFILALFSLFYTPFTTLDSVDAVQLLVLSLLVLSRAVLFEFGISFSGLLFALLCATVDIVSLIVTILIFSSIPNWKIALIGTGEIICIAIWCGMVAVEVVDTIVFVYTYRPFYEGTEWLEIVIAVIMMPLSGLMEFCLVNISRFTFYNHVFSLPYHHWSSLYYPFYRKVFQFLQRVDDKSNPNETAMKLYLINQLLSEYLLTSFSRGELNLDNVPIKEHEQTIHKAAKSAFGAVKRRHIIDISASNPYRPSKASLVHSITQGYVSLFPIVIWLLVFPGQRNTLMLDTQLPLFYWLGLMYIVLLLSMTLWYFLQRKRYYILCACMVQFHEWIDPVYPDSLAHSLQRVQISRLQLRLFDATYRGKWNRLCKQQDKLYDPAQDLYVSHLKSKDNEPLFKYMGAFWFCYEQLENRWYSLRQRARSYTCLRGAWQLPSVLSSLVVGYADREC